MATKPRRFRGAEGRPVIAFCHPAMKIPTNYVSLAEYTSIVIMSPYHCRSWSSEKWAKIQAYYDKLSMQVEKRKEKRV